jgi:5'-nucleotidase
VESVRKNILVCNDDGADAKGLHALIEMVKPYGDVIVVVSETAQSGMSHSISISKPLRAVLRQEDIGYKFYTVAGTPVDCVKLALNQLCEVKPDIMVSGINHGSNAAISVVYSGTMGAAIEAALFGVPSIGFSLLDFSPNANFELVQKYGLSIFETVLKNGLPNQVALNVNFPVIDEKQFNGIKICRQTSGVWKEEFDVRVDPFGRKYYWLTGSFHNLEPLAEDTDEWALKNNFASVVPVLPNFTDSESMKLLKNMNLENE